MKNILVLGSSGFVGSFTYTYLKKHYNVIGVSRYKSYFTDEQCDITKLEDIKNIIKKFKPNIVIHCIKLSAGVDYYETHKEEAYNVDIIGTNNIVECIKKYIPNSKVIYISSDYVYDGTKGNYTEKDKENPINYYGILKLKAEKIIQSLDNHLILRPTVIFGFHPNGKNFFMQLLENQRNKKVMKVPMDQISNPTYIKLLIKIIMRSIEKDLRGIYIATGPESIDRYNFALKLAQHFNFEKNLLVGVKTIELNQSARRPLNCSTIPDKIQRNLNYNFPSLEECIIDLKNEVKKWR